MIVRHATQKDLDALLGIMNDAILYSTAIYDYKPKSKDWIQDWFEQKRTNGDPVLISEEEGLTTGFATYGIFRPKEGYKFSAEHSIYMARNHRGNGTGSALLTALIAEAQQQGYRCLIAAIDGENSSSIRFHEKFGFQEAGRLKAVGYKFERWLDVVYMQLFLDEKTEH